MSEAERRAATGPGRSALAEVLLMLRAGIQWHEVPAELGCRSNMCWRWLHTTGISICLHQVLLDRLDDAEQLD